VGPPAGTAFDELAARYDAWYDSPGGRRLFGLESRCLRPLLEGTAVPRLEVGVGTGRFAVALGLDVGLDPASAPLGLAAGRGVRSVRGSGERLPFADGAFGAVALIVTLCFVDDPAAALLEARRVLRPGGRLALGLVPADSAWGRWYGEKRRAGHPFYRTAHFLTVAEHVRLLEEAGFAPTGARSALFQDPTDPIPDGATGQGRDADVREGARPGAGFVALGARPLS